MPLKVPIAAPSTTSLAQCLLWYMRERPTSVAPPYITGATYHTASGCIRRISLVTADAAAKAAVVCPDGKDCRSLLLNPPNSLKSCGLLSAETYGRARPSEPLSTAVTTDARSTDSVPCHPRSSSHGCPPHRPMAYIPPPMMNAPGDAMTSTPFADL